MLSYMATKWLNQCKTSVNRVWLQIYRAPLFSLAGNQSKKKIQIDAIGLWLITQLKEMWSITVLKQ